MSPTGTWNLSREKSAEDRLRWRALVLDVGDDLPRMPGLHLHRYSAAGWGAGHAAGGADVADRTSTCAPRPSCPGPCAPPCARVGLPGGCTRKSSASEIPWPHRGPPRRMRIWAGKERRARRRVAGPATRTRAAAGQLHAPAGDPQVAAPDPLPQAAHPGPHTSECQRIQKTLEDAGIQAGLNLDSLSIFTDRRS